LAVTRPDWSITAIDATRKKIEFVREAAAAIKLRNLQCEHAHSQHWKPATRSGQPSAHNFQLVVFRALTALAGGTETAAEYVAPGGWLVAYKTASMDHTESEDAGQTAARFGFSETEPYLYSLRSEHEVLQRMLVVYQKRQQANGPLPPFTRS
jgi:16S rRNA G527 N7-methylase RsmG